MIPLILILAFYDFLVWEFIPKTKFDWWHCIAKPILDYLITPLIAIYIFDYSLTTLIYFYILKWFGICDATYIIYYYITYNKSYTDKNIWWLWWSFPLGWIRTIKESFRYGNFQKGEMSLLEFKIQVLAGIILITITWILRQ